MPCLYICICKLNPLICYKKYQSVVFSSLRKEICTLWTKLQSFYEHD